MPKYLLPFLFPGFFVCSCQKNASRWSPGEPLFPIERQGRWGFINQKGAEIVKPKFRGVGAFVGGLSPARLNGTWGFINPKGDFVIEPIFDDAANFSEGIACVWRDGKPFFIDEKGKIQLVLPDSILGVGSFENGKAELTIQKNGRLEYFFLKKNGEIVPNDRIEYSEGLAVLRREVSVKDEEDTRTEYAVQDSFGKLIVPFGKFYEIETFKNGFAQISTEDFERYGFINRKGKLAFLLPKGSHAFDQYFSEGLLAVSTRFDSVGEGTFGSDTHHITWYDTTGNIVLTKKEDRHAMPFKNGRAFTGKIRNWYLMDKTGKQLGSNRFEWVVDDDFSDNMAIVAVHNERSPSRRFDIRFAQMDSFSRANNGDSALMASFINKQMEQENMESVLDNVFWYGAIDSLGNYVIPPKFNEVREQGFQVEGLLVAMNEKISKKHGSPEYQRIKEYWGLIDKKGEWIFQPRFTAVSSAGFENGLLYVELDSLYGYVNPKGEFVWSAIRAKEFSSPEQLNVDFMLRAYCYGRERNYETKDDENSKKPKTSAQPNARAKGFRGNELGIFVNEKEKTRFEERFKGMVAYVFNLSPDTIKIDVQDNRFYIVMQALNSKGEWQDIEYSPSSWCGNSYYDVKLNPDEYWRFDIPVYDGDIQTTLRLAFTWRKTWSTSGKEIKTIYSNSFPGKINPGQFWRKQGHSPSGFMDPYNE